MCFFFYYLGCAKAQTCELQFGKDYFGCDITSFRNVPSWQRCSAICFLLSSCFFFYYLGCAKAQTCELQFGKDYFGCDITSFRNVSSWQRCSAICFLLSSCKTWTWSRTNSTLAPQSCWLKTGICQIRVFSDFISGESRCGNVSIISDCLSS